MKSSTDSKRKDQFRSNGAAAPEPHPETTPGSRTFWPNGTIPSPVTGHSPPLEVDPSDMTGTAVKNAAERVIKASPDEIDGELLQFQLISRAGPATAADQILANKAEQELTKLNAPIFEARAAVVKQLAAIESQLEQNELDRQAAAKAYAAHSAKAGIPCPIAQISREKFLKALANSAPTLEQLAGECGMIPPPPEKKDSRWSWLPALWENLLVFIAFGFVDGVAFGSLAGFVTYNTLHHPDQYDRLVVPALLGMAITYAQRTTATWATTALALTREPQGKEGEIRFRFEVGITHVMACILLLLVMASIFIHATAFQHLEIELLAGLNRDRQVPLEAHELWFWAIPGALITLCVTGKAAIGTWAGKLAELRKAKLLHLQGVWIQKRSKASDVQEAAEAAGQLEHFDALKSGLLERRDVLQKVLESPNLHKLDDETTKLLEAAHSAAIVETNVLHTGLQKHAERIARPPADGSQTPGVPAHGAAQSSGDARESSKDRK